MASTSQDDCKRTTASNSSTSEEKKASTAKTIKRPRKKDSSLTQQASVALKTNSREADDMRNSASSISSSQDTVSDATKPKPSNRLPSHRPKRSCVFPPSDAKAKLARSLSPVARFHPIRMPHFSGAYYSRPEDEVEIYNEIIETCNNPGTGVYVIAGEGGVGKTTLMSRLLRSEPGQFVVNARKSNGTPAALEKDTVVLWMGCFKWKGETITDANKKTFTDEMIELAKDSEPTFDRTCHRHIISFFEERGKRVLFVFDDMFNVAILEHFVNNQVDGSKLSCCAITRNPVPLQYNNTTAIIRKVRKLEALTEAGIQVMLEDVLKMKGHLLSDQIKVLATFCCGLPLIASLIRSQFDSAHDDRGKVWGGIYMELRPKLTKLSNEKLSQADRKIENIRQLFELSIDQLPDDLRSSFYAFLFFDPGTFISVRDLAIFWGGSNIVTVVEKLKFASLVRSVNSETASDEEMLFVHQMLFEAALHRALAEFDLSNSNDGLEQIRVRLVKGLILVGDKTAEETREMVMFEAVRQQRLSLCRRFVDVISTENLADLCQEHSDKPEDKDMSSFLHFLYHKTWKDFDITYPEGHRLYKSGINNSYRLIAIILLKMQREKLQLSRVLELIDSKTTVQGEISKSLLGDILEDAKEESQYRQRQILANYCRKWYDIYKESKWMADNKEQPWIRLLLQGKQDELLELLWKRKESSDQMRIDEEIEKETNLITAACRIGKTDTLQKLYRCLSPKKLTSGDRQDKTCLMFAAQNGHLDVVKFLFETDQTAVSQAKHDGWTAIMSAAQNGHLDVVKFLFETDQTAVCQAKNDGWTAIMSAAENGHLDVVKFLIETDRTAVSQADNDGWTAIMSAAKNGHLDVVKFLIETDRTAVSQANKEGWTAIMAAALNGHFDVVKFLCETDQTAVSQVSNSGSTAIIYAALNGHLDVVKFLIETDRTAVSQAKKDGRTAIMSAAENGHLDVVKFLIETDPTAVSQASAPGLSP